MALRAQSRKEKKIRVVFNASANTESGVALNKVLFRGPKLQNDITSILIDWRFYPFVYTTDIKKMFRQFLIDEEDRPFQCILWRDNPTDPIQIFQLNTITYGMICSPYLSMRCIKELVNLYRNEFPLAVKFIEHNIYVDDILFGAFDLQTLKETRKQVENLLKKAQLELSKWCSNVSDLHEHSEKREKSFEKDEKETELFERTKILGLIWSPVNDTFSTSYRYDSAQGLSKRMLLSRLSTLFDPLGFFSPVTIVGKQFMQSLWLYKLDWDEIIPDHLLKKWTSFVEQLKQLPNISIPRWIQYSDKSTKTFQLIGFADACLLSYSAIVYSRVIQNDGTVYTSILMAKTKLAPLQSRSIAQLELCAATLLVKTLLHVKNSIDRKIDNIFCFSDSKNVLAWIAKVPSSWTVFIANRVSYIQTTLTEARWGYVRSEENPADLNSRGISAEDLQKSNLWWHGPEFLTGSVEFPLLNEFTTDLGKRKSQIIHHAKTEWNFDWFFKYSKWSRLIRIAGYVFRFINQIKKINLSKSLALSFEEIQNAKFFVIQQLQNHYFSSEIRLLQKEKSLPNSSRLSPLSPFLDQSGILRLGGRLQNSILPESQKHPIILESDFVAKLLIRHFHLVCLHGGVQLTLNILRKEYWIISARSATKTIVNECVVCLRERAKLCSAYMAPLPPARCSSDAPVFSHTAVDYAGPLYVRSLPGPGYTAHKCYIAVFVCLSVKAVHIELVHSLSTRSFLEAFDRFTADRGLVTEMYSDNGTAFTGANNELKRVFKQALLDEKFQSNLAVKGIHWNFIPPNSPHFGGLHEAGVKSMKTHLSRIIGKFTPSVEELNTIIKRIQACLNSRPLVRPHDTPDDLDVLTPGHFLIGRELLAPPVPCLLKLHDNVLARWQRGQKIVQSFWKKYINYYLSTLQSRNKWRQNLNQIKLNDIVILKNDNNPPCKWTIGRIVREYPGPDKIKRVFDVQTKTGIYTRNITRMCKLTD